MSDKQPVVYKTHCMHCNKPLVPDTLIWAVAFPNHCLLHENCAAFFAYSNGWPHAQPYEQYFKNSRAVLKLHQTS